jgi:hypothetical protein
MTVLQGCNSRYENWSWTVGEEWRLGIFENRILKKYQDPTGIFTICVLHQIFFRFSNEEE